MKRKKTTDEDRAARARTRRNNERLLALAEKAQADLDRRKHEREST